VSVHPNPCNPQTSIEIAVDRKQRVRVGIYDLRGRLVNRLADRVYKAGSLIVDWNGRSGGGRDVGAGMYLVRVELEGRVQVGKVMVVR